MRRLRDADAAERTERWYWRRVLDEIGRRHLDPLGLDVWDIYDDVMENTPDLKKKYRERLDRNPERGYISVDEHTTARDVGRAFRMLSANGQARSPAGAPQRDPLTALQCAILYERHNGRDPRDARKKKWSYEKLRARFNLRSGRAAEEYVREGRDLLQ